jgi:hypothetical protein
MHRAKSMPVQLWIRWRWTMVRCGGGELSWCGHHYFTAEHGDGHALITSARQRNAAANTA